MTLPRSSGVLLHPTSLPGGRLGDEAFRFVDWLAAAGPAWGQGLPPGPPGARGAPDRPASGAPGGLRVAVPRGLGVRRPPGAPRRSRRAGLAGRARGLRGPPSVLD